MEMHVPRQMLKMILSFIKSLSRAFFQCVNTTPTGHIKRGSAPCTVRRLGTTPSLTYKGTATATAQTKRVL